MHINAASEYVEELVRFVDYLYTEGRRHFHLYTYIY